MIPSYYAAPSVSEGCMPMRGDDRQTGWMFSYVSPEDRVPADHPLRATSTKRSIRASCCGPALAATESGQSDPCLTPSVSRRVTRAEGRSCPPTR